jgi:hypothetical protein
VETIDRFEVTGLEHSRPRLFRGSGAAYHIVRMWLAWPADVGGDVSVKYFVDNV